MRVWGGGGGAVRVWGGREGMGGGAVRVWGGGEGGRIEMLVFGLNVVCALRVAQ